MGGESGVSLHKYTNELIHKWIGEATSDTGVWASPLFATGSFYSRTFTEAGSFPYHCEPHPFMKATVVVR